MSDEKTEMLTDRQHYRISAHAMGWIHNPHPKFDKLDDELLELGYIERNPRTDGGRLFLITEAGEKAHDRSVAQCLEMATEAATISSGTIASLIGVSDYATIERIQHEFVTFCRLTPRFTTWQEAWKAFDWVALIP